MSVQRYLEYDVGAEESKVQVVMVRGLFSSWKQTIFIAFQTRVTVSVLNYMIERLREVAYDVVTVVSDNGAENVSLRAQLGMTMANSSILLNQDLLENMFAQIRNKGELG